MHNNTPSFSALWNCFKLLRCTECPMPPAFHLFKSSSNTLRIFSLPDSYAFYILVSNVANFLGKLAMWLVFLSMLCTCILSTWEFSSSNKFVGIVDGMDGQKRRNFFKIIGWNSWHREIWDISVGFNLIFFFWDQFMNRLCCFSCCLA